MSEEKVMGELRVPPRVLMGPGPSNIHPQVLLALAQPPLGHLDPQFMEILQENALLLRQVFRTRNLVTLAMSGTGTSGMEAAFYNVIEPGDRVLVGVYGYFGERMLEIVRRCGGEPVVLSAEWGRSLPVDQVINTLKANSFKAVALVHAETSTGTRQDIAEVGAFCRERDILLIVDTVTSLGGMPVEVDTWGIDVCYSATQKCLGAPSGLAPITFSDRAVEILRKRKTPVLSFYLDADLMTRYWREKVYHHTASSHLHYALREALRLILEEGLEARWERHRQTHQKLVEGLEELGLELLPPPNYRLPMLNAVKVPEGVEEAEVRAQLLHRYGIEIGAGLGPLKGRIWRIGLMGYGASLANVAYLLDALREVLKDQRK